LTRGRAIVIFGLRLALINKTQVGILCHGALAGSAGVSPYSRCVRNQSFSALLGTLSQKPVAI